MCACVCVCVRACVCVCMRQTEGKSQSKTAAYVAGLLNQKQTKTLYNDNEQPFEGIKKTYGCVWLECVFGYVGLRDYRELLS